MQPYAFTNTLFVGFFAFTAIHYCIMWWLSRNERLLLYFSAHCTFFALFLYSLLGIARSQTIPEFETALDGRITFGLLATITTVWILCLLTDVRAPRYSRFVTVFCVATILVNLFVYRISGGIKQIEQMTLPWGEQVTIAVGVHPGWWVLPIYLVVISADFFGLYVAIRVWSRDRIGALLIAFASGGSLAAAAVALFVDILKGRMPYIGDLPYAAWVILVGVQMSREYRRRHDALLRSEERYRLIVDNQTEFVVKYLPDGTRTFVNESYCRYFGLTEQEAIGTSFMPLVAPDFRDLIRQKIASITPENPEQIDEHEVIAADGTIRWQEWIDCGRFSPDGKLLDILSTGRDVTDRIQSERALRQSEERYRLLTEHARLIFWEADVKTFCFTYVSDSAAEFLGIPAEQWYGSGFWESRIHPDDREEAVASCLAHTESRKDHRFEYRMLRADGRVIWVEDVVKVVLKRGEVVALRGLLIDVTERKRLEEELRHAQKMEAIGRLAGGIAHDFNNIITVVSMYGHSLLENMPTDDPRRDAAQAVLAAAERAETLTRSILAFGRKQIMRPTTIDMNEVVRGSESLLRRLLDSGIRFAVTLDARPCLVNIDPHQMERVLLNLVMNARDAMPDGGGLSLATEIVPTDRREDGEQADRYVQLSVEDTGTGIDDAVRERIFEPFFTTKPRGQGSGMGLSVVDGIVEQSGGHIGVESRRGVGTTIRIRLPHAGDLAAPLSARRLTEGNQGREMILVVDDEEPILKAVSALLSRAGYNVLTAASVAEAIALSQRHRDKIRLLLTDVVMPDGDGRQIAETLQNTCDGLRVLLMSGYHEAQSATAVSGVRVLEKPFTPEALTAAVRQALERTPS